ncbi:hypothetical protein B0H13DRAFT_2331924 [Mycena leptocephala]|nr:hypothetical protein B0H13DRAFT_2331924 [Mycena leptocephala]
MDQGSSEAMQALRGCEVLVGGHEWGTWVADGVGVAEPRHRPTPDAHAHAQAAAGSFHPRHPVITLLLHSALLPPHSGRVPVLRAHASSSPSAAALMRAAPHAPLAARGYPRPCMPTLSRTSRCRHAPLCTPPALPRRIDHDHDLYLTPYTTSSSCSYGSSSFAHVFVSV